MFVLLVYPTALKSHIFGACSCACGVKTVPLLLSSCLVLPVEDARSRESSTAYVLFLQLLVLVGDIVPIPGLSDCIYILYCCLMRHLLLLGELQCQV